MKKRIFLHLHILAHISSREQSSKWVSAHPPSPSAGMVSLNPFRTLQCKLIIWCSTQSGNHMSNYPKTVNGTKKSYIHRFVGWTDIWNSKVTITLRLSLSCPRLRASFWGRKPQTFCPHRSYPPQGVHSPINSVKYNRGTPQIFLLLVHIKRLLENQIWNKTQKAWFPKALKRKKELIPVC